MKAIIIIAIICVTLIILALIGTMNNRLDRIEDALRREDEEIKMLWGEVNQ